MSSTFSDVLSCLDTFYVENALNFFIPSLKKDVKFKPLSIDQQRRFIDLRHQYSDLAMAEFSEVYDVIIKESCIDSVEIDDFTSLDRVVIALQHRAEIDDDLVLVLDDDEGVTVSVKVSDYVQNVKNAKIELPKRPLRHKNIKIHVGLPTLSRDNATNRFAKEIIEYDPDDTQVEIQAKIDKNQGDMVLLTFIKYIDKIEVGELELTSKDSNPGQMLTIVRKLPGAFLKRLLTQMLKFRDTETTPLTMSHKIDKVDRDVTLQVNSVLFTGA